jgi:predicted O-methyltransferase YrrM
VTPEDVRERLAELTAGAWVATAVGVAIEVGLPARLREPTCGVELASATGLPVALATALAEALVAAGLARRADEGFMAAPALVEMTAGPGGPRVQTDQRAGLLQMAAFFDAATRGAVATGWTHTDERLLQAQGATSAGAVDDVEREVLPQLTGLRGRLASGDAVLLDAGAGVAAVTIAFCRRHPRLRAVALEPHDEARRLAERNVADAGLASRIEVRGDRVEELAAREQFDLVWLPGNFLGPDVLPAALAAVRTAMRPGGWLLNASLGSPGDDHRAVAGRLREVLWSGGTAEPECVARWIEDAGFCDVVLMPRRPSGRVRMRARRPAIG